MQFEAAVAAFEPELPIAVAYSGGADSTALLLACVRKWPGQVEAIHVNHALQAAAKDFQVHCERVCKQFGIALRVVHVNAQAAPRQSPEEAARDARYSAFRSFLLSNEAAIPVRSFAIAHHADDQVETLLLAWGRGAGLGGLSGMPEHWVCDDVHYYRPLLEVPASDIRRWLVCQGASFIEDPSNQDARFTRNRIRHQLLGPLGEAFPHFRSTFARSARHIAQAQSVLDEVAQADLAQLLSGHEKLAQIKSLQQLSYARQANALRYWLKKEFRVIPSTVQLAELQNQITACTTRGHRIHLKVGNGFVQRKGSALTWYNP
jgi:tRNA(Ile)-lysidine synthase